MAGLAAIVVIGAACGGGGAKKAASTTSSAATSTSTIPATTTTAPPPPIAPLTGLAQPDAAALKRVALVVKIDNVDQARPQAGLTKADMVFEEMVEGRLTRLIAVFQSTVADPVGPVRSTRTTDLDIVSALNHPLYAYSGGNSGFVARLHAAPITDVGDTGNGLYFRGRGAAPHNLYAKASSLFALAPAGSQPPQPFFQYRSAGQPASGATPAVHADLNFGDTGASWDWDAASGTWKRGQNGTADVDQSGQQISAANVIIQLLPYSIDGYATGEGISPAPPIPKGESVGNGTALILTGGGVIHATWSKSAPTSITQWADPAGQPVRLTPGQTWVELAPVGTAPNIH